MMWDLGYEETIGWVANAIDAAGVVIIAVGATYATLRYLPRLLQGTFAAEYRPWRETVGRIVLLGLEFLVAGSIIRTVAVNPDFHSVGVLTVIIGIRTVLSLVLGLEITGRWPWHSRDQEDASAAAKKQ